MLRSFLVTLVAASAAVSAHMQLQYPPPIRSKYDPQTVEANIDYSMSNPLLADGSNYPCKNYNTPEVYASTEPVATLTAGSPFKISFAAGGATHLGGSCQFSVSYDQGKTFAVIYSVEGGCPLSLTYSVPIPASLPSSPKATFAWTWVSRTTREMYGNCAIVAIKGDGSAKSFTGPGLFRANTLSDGTCISPIDSDVVYPNPGQYVEYGGSIGPSSPPTVLEPCSYNQITTVTISPTEPASSPEPSSSTKPSAKPSSATSQWSTPPTPASSTSSAGYEDVSATAVTTVSPSTTSAVIDGTSTVPRMPWVSRYVVTTSVGSPATTSTASVASSTTLATASASPTVSTSTRGSSTSSRASSATPSSTSSPSDPSSAYLKCLSPYSFALCAGSNCTDMGSVAAGTICQNGTIIMAPAVKNKRMDKLVRRAGSALAHARPRTH